MLRPKVRVDQVRLTEVPTRRPLLSESRDAAKIFWWRFEAEMVMDASISRK